MTADAFEPVEIGRTGVRVTRLSFGGATIGGLFREVADADAVATVRHAAAIGVRYFDVAPAYGYGNSERRVGIGLAGRPRASFTLSTKVGRLLVPRDRITPEMDVDYQRADGQDDYYYRGTPPVRPVFDYSYDGVLRSLDESLERLGLDGVDILYVHDPDNHFEEALTGAIPALVRLRAEGVVRAIGVGMNQSAMLLRFARETDVDVFLVAGRYTLLDQGALADFLPLCAERGIAVVAGGVFNSGILADPRPGSRFGYLPADEHILERAQRMRQICERHGTSLRAAAVQFVLAHPAIVSVLAGVRNAAQLDEYPDLIREQIPAAVWDELKAEGLVREDAPTPDAHDVPGVHGVHGDPAATATPAIPAGPGPVGASSPASSVIPTPAPEERA
jgi:D-threo-aldose 1-dehydrogenase